MIIEIAKEEFVLKVYFNMEKNKLEEVHILFAHFLGPDGK